MLYAYWGLGFRVSITFRIAGLRFRCLGFIGFRGLGFRVQSYWGNLGGLGFWGYIWVMLPQ